MRSSVSDVGNSCLGACLICLAPMHDVSHSGELLMHDDLQQLCSGGDEVLGDDLQQ